MESRRGKWRGEVVAMVLVLVLCFTSMLLLLSACAFFSCGSKALGWAPDTRSDCSTADSNSQVLAASRRRRRQLRAGGGPGSYPPRCMGKCGNCNPCFPVHVPVPPVPAEYYPEAWRCKCGSRLFMP